MYAGHFSIGLVLKPRFPRVPAVPIMVGVVLLDVLNGLSILVGIDVVTPNSDRGPYLFSDLDFIDWDHSMLMAILWALAWGLFFVRDRRVAVIAMAAVLSHFLADWPMHDPDLALYPYSETRLGLGLWRKLGTASWLLEGLFAAVLAWYAWLTVRGTGVGRLWPCLLLLGLFLQLSPWVSPMKFVATLEEPAAHIVRGALVAVGALVPALLFSWLLSRGETNLPMDNKTPQG